MTEAKFEKRQVRPYCAVSITKTQVIALDSLLIELEKAMCLPKDVIRCDRNYFIDIEDEDTGLVRIRLTEKEYAWLKMRAEDVDIHLYQEQ